MQGFIFFDCLCALNQQKLQSCKNKKIKQANILLTSQIVNPLTPFMLCDTIIFTKKTIIIGYS